MSEDKEQEEFLILLEEWPPKFLRMVSLFMAYKKFNPKFSLTLKYKRFHPWVAGLQFVAKQAKEKNSFIYFDLSEEELRKEILKMKPRYIKFRANKNSINSFQLLRT